MRRGRRLDIPVKKEEVSIMTSKNKRVVLGMSGGVDSSVAVHLLQKAGYEVHGVHMLMIPDEFGANPDAARDAESVAKQFNISFSVLDVRDKFRNIIIQQFANEYSNGRTPNPCVLCNKVFKFGFLADELQKFDADYISTGHYVNSTEYVLGDKGNCYHLFHKAADAKKDQSFYKIHGHQCAISVYSDKCLCYRCGTKKQDQYLKCDKDIFLIQL